MKPPRRVRLFGMGMRYYRDPNVLGGCPPSSTLNATQTGRIPWWP